MPAYPVTLPRPLTDGYVITPVDQTARSDMDAGAARVRRRTSARNDQIEVVFHFTDAQFATFRAWFDDAATGISGGAAWFDTTLRIGNGGSSAVSARFVGPWKSQRDQQEWKISAKLEVR